MSLSAALIRTLSAPRRLVRAAMPVTPPPPGVYVLATPFPHVGVPA